MTQSKAAVVWSTAGVWPACILSCASSPVTQCCMPISRLNPHACNWAAWYITRLPFKQTSKGALFIFFSVPLMPAACRYVVPAGSAAQFEAALEQQKGPHALAALTAKHLYCSLPSAVLRELGVKPFLQMPGSAVPPPPFLPPPPPPKPPPPPPLLA